jgi:hypothetical protein
MRPFIFDRSIGITPPNFGFPPITSDFSEVKLPNAVSMIRIKVAKADEITGRVPPKLALKRINTAKAEKPLIEGGMTKGSAIFRMRIVSTYVISKISQNIVNDSYDSRRRTLNQWTV